MFVGLECKDRLLLLVDEDRQAFGAINDDALENQGQRLGRRDGRGARQRLALNRPPAGVEQRPCQDRLEVCEGRQCEVGFGRRLYCA